MGRVQEAIAPLEEAVRLSNGDIRAIAALGHALGVAGRPAAARAILQTLEKRSRQQRIELHYGGVGDGLGRDEPPPDPYLDDLGEPGDREVRREGGSVGDRGRGRAGRGWGGRCSTTGATGGEAEEDRGGATKSHQVGSKLTTPVAMAIARNNANYVATHIRGKTTINGHAFTGRRELKDGDVLHFKFNV